MTLRLLVLSDTHLRRGVDLPDEVLRLADRADHACHVGDLVSVDVLDVLEALVPVTAVCGNVDDGAVAARLPERAEVELDGVRIALVHDAGRADGRHARLGAWFPGADLMLYGHSHTPELTWLPGNRIVCNPGSPTQRRRAPTHTLAWFELDGGVVGAADLVHL